MAPLGQNHWILESPGRFSVLLASISKHIIVICYRRVTEGKQRFCTSIQQPIQTKRLQLPEMNPAILHLCATATALTRVMPLRWLEWV